MLRKSVFLFILLGMWAAQANAGQVISAVARRNSTNGTPVVAGPLANNSVCFVDRGYVYQNVPAILVGLEYVEMAMGDKTVANVEIDVTLAVPATLYLFIDPRVGDGSNADPPTLGPTVMKWVLDMGFKRLDIQIGMSDGQANYFNVYALDVPAGKITLKEQNDGSGRNMYTVAAASRGPGGKATNPAPADKATNTPRDVALGWTAGGLAQKHDVYFGTTFADVNNATVAKPLNVLASQGQTDTAYQPANALQYGQTYYWRIDEVNAAANPTLFKGDVWSFTIEPYAAAITNITATASSSDKTTTGPINTINGSGLTGDLHSTSSDAMWISSGTGPTPVWIQYQFDKVYTLFELWVWNHNTEYESILGYGFKDVTIEYSLDGKTWTALGDFQFAQAPGTNGYAHNTTVNLKGVAAQYIRLTAKSNWSLVGVKQYGLSEVRFSYVPVQARAPQPASGATGINLDATLSWQSGRTAASHKVYLGTDQQAVANSAVAVQTVTGHSFNPAALQFGTTYYWKVDEVNDTTNPKVWAGDVWSFTTKEYAVVDDFESYNDADNRIYNAWIDGLTNGNSGSVVGYLVAPFAEQKIIHGGKQSMPFEYNNVKTPFYSEAMRTFDTPQDWTGNGATHVDLWFRGYPALTSMAVTETAGKMTLTGSGADIWGNSDQFGFAFKTLTGDGSILARVVDKG
jgi:hypothetical protein